MPIALFSTYDKSKILKFATKLSKMNWHFMATGGTARVLRDAGIEVKSISDFTGSPEILDGSVKTLHPAVYAGILAKPTPNHLSDLARVNANMIDLVVVDLRPFRMVAADSTQTHEAIVDAIDVGGTELVRAAAKNYDRVAVIVDLEGQSLVLKDLSAAGVISEKTREALAIRAFRYVSNYDGRIAEYLEEHKGQG